MCGHQVRKIKVPYIHTQAKSEHNALKGFGSSERFGDHVADVGIIRHL